MGLYRDKKMEATVVSSFHSLKTQVYIYVCIYIYMLHMHLYIHCMFGFSMIVTGFKFFTSHSLWGSWFTIVG